MSGTTSNLTAAERMALPAGAVVEYRIGKMLSGIRTTVKEVKDNPIVVVMDDGQWIGAKDELVMVSTAGGLAFPHRTDFAPDDQTHAARLQKAEGDASGGREGAPPRTPQGMQSAADTTGLAGKAGGAVASPQAAVAGPAAQKGIGGCKTAVCKTRKLAPRADHGLWLRAIRAVRELMAAGKRRQEAVAEVGGRAEFAGIKIGVSTYSWWTAQFRAHGKLPPATTGRGAKGKGLKPSLQAHSSRPQDPGRLQDPMTETAELRDRCDRLAEDLAAARSSHRTAEGEVQRLSAEVAELGKKTLELRIDRAAGDHLREERDAAQRERDQAREGHRKASVELQAVCAEMDSLKATNRELATALAQRSGQGSAAAAPAGREPKRVDMDALMTEASELMSRWMSALALAQIGREACADLHELVAVVRGLQAREEGGQG